MSQAKPMSVIDLFVLGLLHAEPMNAYGLANAVEERGLDRLVKVSKPAIYKSCRRLAAAGYLTGKRVRETEAPEKVVYTVSKAGSGYFRELMLHFSERISPFHFEFNTFIWNLHRLEHAEAMRMLRRLQSELGALQAWLLAHEREQRGADFGARVVVKQYRMVITALVQWMKETIEEFQHAPRGR